MPSRVPGVQSVVFCCCCGARYELPSRLVAYRSLDRLWWCTDEVGCRIARDMQGVRDERVRFA